MQKKTKINYYSLSAVVVIGLLIGYVGAMAYKRLNQNPKPLRPDVNETESPFLHVSPLELSFEAGGSRQHLALAANTNWRVEVAEGNEWLSVVPVEGTDSAQLVLTALKNTGKARAGRLIVKWTGSEGPASIEVGISQMEGGESPVPPVPVPGIRLVVSTSKVKFKPDDGKRTFGISSNTKWQLSLDGGADWLSITPTEGSNNNTVDIVAKANGNQQSRYATITIRWNDENGGNHSQQVRVEQDGALPPPPPCVTVEQAQAVVAAGRQSGIIPDGVSVSLNGKKMTYKKFCAELTKKSYSNVQVKHVDCDKAGKVARIDVTATKVEVPVQYVTEEQAQEVVATGRQSSIIPDETTLKVNGKKMNYGAFRAEMAKNVYENVRVTHVDCNKQTGKVTLISVTAAIAPKPCPITKEEVTAIARSGKPSTKVVDNCIVVVNNRNTDYQSFSQGVDWGTITNVKVTDFSTDKNCKLSRIVVTANTKVAND